MDFVFCCYNVKEAFEDGIEAKGSYQEGKIKLKDKSGTRVKL